MELRGKCVKVFPLETGTGKKGEWKKLNFMIEYGDEFPKQVYLTLFGDKANNVPAVGDQLVCQVSPESREYNGKYYTNINVWKIEGFTGNMKKAQPAAQGASVADEFDKLPKSQVTAPTQDSSTDELPF